MVHVLGPLSFLGHHLLVISGEDGVHLTVLDANGARAPHWREAAILQELALQRVCEQLGVPVPAPRPLPEEEPLPQIVVWIDGVGHPTFGSTKKNQGRARVEIVGLENYDLRRSSKGGQRENGTMLSGSGSSDPQTRET